MRATFSPRGEGTKYEKRQTTNSAGKNQRSNCAPLDPPGQRHAERAEGDDRGQLPARERVTAPVGEGAREHHLGRADADDDERGHQQPAAPLAQVERHSRQDDRQEQEGQRAREQREHGQHAELPALPRLQRPQREEAEREPKRERERGRDDQPGPDDRERPARPAGERPPFPTDDDGERERRGRNRGDGERLDPEQRGQRVVDDAVRDEAVTPAVPEVVPELVAVVQEDGALVDVGGQVITGRAEPGEKGGEAGGGRGCEQSLPHEGARAIHETEGYSLGQSAETELGFET